MDISAKFLNDTSCMLVKYDKPMNTGLTGAPPDNISMSKMNMYYHEQVCYHYFQFLTQAFWFVRANQVYGLGFFVDDLFGYGNYDNDFWKTPKYDGVYCFDETKN